MVTIFILSVLSVFLIGVIIILYYKYKEKVDKINEIDKELNNYNRIGFISFGDNVQVELEELGKFKNGYSKIRIKKIHLYQTSFTENDVRKRLKVLMKTEDIGWLEEDEDITEVRRKN